MISPVVVSGIHVDQNLLAAINWLEQARMLSYNSRLAVVRSLVLPSSLAHRPTDCCPSRLTLKVCSQCGEATKEDMVVAAFWHLHCLDSGQSQAARMVMVFCQLAPHLDSLFMPRAVHLRQRPSWRNLTIKRPYRCKC